MTEFNSRPLGVLQRIWNFVGGLGPTGLKGMQLSGDILPVACMSRMAMLGSGQGLNQGYYIMKLTTIHAVADSQTEVLNAYDPVNVFSSFTQMDPGTEWLWVMSAWCVANAGSANFTSGDLAMNAGTGGSPVTLLGAFEPAGSGPGTNEARKLIFQSTGMTGIGFAIPNPGVLVRPTVFPFAMGVLNWFTVSAGAGTFTVAVLVWRGPIGTTPPGIA